MPRGGVGGKGRTSPLVIGIAVVIFLAIISIIAFTPKPKPILRQVISPPIPTPLPVVDVVKPKQRKTFHISALAGIYQNFHTVYDLSYEELMQHQFPEKCVGKRFLIAPLVKQGMMYNLVYLQDAFAYALATNRILILMEDIEVPWEYAPSDLCRDDDGNYRTWGCYFEPLTNCTPPLSRKQATCWNRAGANESSVALISRNRCPFFSNPYFKPEIKDDVWRLDFASHNQFNRFMLRPNKRVRERIRQIKEKLTPALDGVYDGMHVRWGDKALESPRHAWLEYTTALKSLPKSEKVKYIFVATDAPQIVENATSASKMGDVRYVFNPFESHQAGGQWKNGKLECSSECKYEHAINFASDVLLLAGARHFAGTQSSNVGAAVIHLLCGKRRDVNWPSCFAKTLDGYGLSQANHPDFDGPLWSSRPTCRDAE